MSPDRRPPGAVADPEEQSFDAGLRPRRLAEFVGQPRVREQLSLVLASAQRRGQPPDHILLSGPPGLGKTSLAMIIAAELGVSLRLTSGPAIERSGDLVALLTSLEDSDVLFIDEIHRIARPAEELLYSAMEDLRVDVVLGKGPGATAIPLQLRPFTLVGATTRSGLLTAPLHDRFGFTAHLDFYSVEELEQVLHRSADLLAIPLDTSGAHEIARRSRGTPRIANRLLRRVRDYAEVRGNGIVDLACARAALTVYDVDEAGLDRLDTAVLDALVCRFAGGPVGLSSLALAVGEEPETVSEVCEPFLVRRGLLARTPRGRVATAEGWRHVGRTPPAGPLFALDLAGDGEDATGHVPAAGESGVDGRAAAGLVPGGRAVDGRAADGRAVGESGGSATRLDPGVHEHPDAEADRTSTRLSGLSRRRRSEPAPSGGSGQP